MPSVHYICSFRVYCTLVTFVSQANHIQDYRKEIKEKKIKEKIFKKIIYCEDNENMMRLTIAYAIITLFENRYKCKQYLNKYNKHNSARSSRGFIMKLTIPIQNLVILI